MSTSSPVRTRQPRRESRNLSRDQPRPPPAGGDRPRGQAAQAAIAVGRSILLVVAAVSVIGTSNYFAYQIGRKQATYEELRRQVDRVVRLMGRTQAEEERAPITLKERQDRLEQTAPGLTGLTTSTINGKTTATAPAGSPAPAAPVDAAPVASPPATSPAAATKPHDTRGGAHQRAARRPKLPKPAADAMAEQPSANTAPAATPDVGAAGQ